MLSEDKYIFTEKLQRTEIRRQRVGDIKNMIEERKNTVTKNQVKDKVIRDTWALLINQGLGNDCNQEQRKKQQEVGTYFHHLLYHSAIDLIFVFFIYELSKVALLFYLIEDMSRDQK